MPPYLLIWWKIYAIYRLQTSRTYFVQPKVTTAKSHKIDCYRKEGTPTGKLTKWIWQLEMYLYEIIHRPGHRIPHVDALSRRTLNTLSMQGFWSKDEFVVAQEEDSGYRESKEIG